MAFTNTTTDGVTGIFLIPEEGAQIPKLSVTNADITFTAQEIVTVDQNGIHRSVARLNVSNVDVSEGTIAFVLIRYQRNIGAAPEWSQWIPFSVNWTGLDNAGTFDIEGMPTAKGTSVTFELRMVNSDNEDAQDSTGAQVYKSTTQTFNGITDFNEYPEVTNLKATNSDQTDGGTWSAPGSIPRTGIIHLEWDDMTKHECVAGNGTCEGNHPVGDEDPNNLGQQLTDSTITKEQWKNTKRYRVYMWVANATATGGPDTDWPTTTDSNGTWYFVKTVATNSADVDCPRGKKVAFWVCAEMGEVISGSPIDSVPSVPKTAYE